MTGPTTDTLDPEDFEAVAAFTRTIWLMVEMDAIGAAPNEVDTALRQIPEAIPADPRLLLGTVAAIVANIVREYAAETGRTRVEIIDALHGRGH